MIKKISNVLVFFSLFFFLGKSTYGLDLLESVNLSKNSDSLFLMAKTRMKIISENQEQAFSQLLPTVTVQVARSQVQQERKDNIQKFPTQTYTTESDALTLNQPVYRPKLFSELKKAKKLTSSSELEAKNEEQNLLLRVALSYLNNLATTDNVLLQKKKIELIREQKRFAEKSILAGTGTKTDLLEVSVSLDRAEATLIQLLQQKDFSLAELSVLVGKNIKNIYSFNHKRFEPEDFDPGSLNKWQNNSLKNNPQLMSVGERLDAAKIAIQSAKYDHFPSVDFTAQISKGSSESTFFVNNSTETKSVGFTFFMPIYQGGLVNSRVRQSMEQYNLESEELRKLENEIKIRVQASYNGVLEKKALIKALIKAQESAQSLLIANERSVELGIRRRLDVLVSQQQLISVEKDLALTRFELISGWLSLHFNSGLSLDREIEFINSFLRKAN